MKEVYKYRSLDGIIKYEVIAGEFGVDSTLHLRDTSCTHYGDKCEIEVVLNEDGKSYSYSKPLNDNAKKYEYFHTMEKYWDNKKDAFVEGLEISIDSSRRSIDGYEEELAKTLSKLEGLTQKGVHYLRAFQVKIGEKYYVADTGMCKVIGSISFEDGSKGYLTNENYCSSSRFEEDGDRIILIENGDKIVTENGDSVFLTNDDWNNLKINKEIDRLNNIVEITKRNIATAIRRIEHYQSLIEQRDILTFEAMNEMRNNFLRSDK